MIGPFASAESEARGFKLGKAVSLSILPLY
jgi:hypothetical protein